MLFYTTILTESQERCSYLAMEMGAKKIYIEYLEWKREIDINKSNWQSKTRVALTAADIAQLTIPMRAISPHQGATGVMLVIFFRSLLLNPTLMTNSPLGISHSCDTTPQ
jgi:hypothetical protein